MSVDALVELTGASPITIRRDLADLEGQGVIKRFHGGATSVGQRGTRTPYALRSLEDSEQKEAFAAVAASLVEDQESVVLDGGTTVDAIARRLRGRPITVLCMALRAAVTLGEHQDTHVIVPGGLVSPDTLVSDCSRSIAALRDMRADVAFLGVAAASSAHGLTTAIWEDAQVKRAIIRSATRRILTATAQKLARTSSFRFADLEDIDDLITTEDIPEPLLDQFREAGVTVHTTKRLAGTSAGPA